jgi:hypothetical protein
MNSNAILPNKGAEVLCKRVVLRSLNGATNTGRINAKDTLAHSAAATNGNRAFRIIVYHNFVMALCTEYD